MAVDCSSLSASPSAAITAIASLGPGVDICAQRHPRGEQLRGGYTQTERHVCRSVQCNNNGCSLRCVAGQREWRPGLQCKQSMTLARKPESGHVLVALAWLASTLLRVPALHECTLRLAPLRMQPWPRGNAQRLRLCRPPSCTRQSWGDSLLPKPQQQPQPQPQQHQQPEWM